MALPRSIDRVLTIPPPVQGFVGPGHLASLVVSVEDFAQNDPFIMLADDRLDIGERPVGGPHPHAGFETVTLMLDGEIYDRDEGGVIAAGEVQWMTAGRGIIHGENVATHGKVRLLQLWLTLPKAQRWMPPGFQDIHTDAVPVRREPGVDARIYSGASGPFSSRTRNQVPVTIVELALQPRASFEQALPRSYNGFAYVIDGSVEAGATGALLADSQVGWLDRPETDGESVLTLRAGENGARVVLYAGQPQGDPIVSHGPFIGDTKADIVRLYNEYRAGEFMRLSTLTRA